MIIKEICFDDDSGKLTLITSEGKSYFCDLYGNPEKSFNPRMTGIASAKERKVKVNTEIDFRNVYLPKTHGFEGSSKFPRPLVSPLTNIDEDEVKKSTKKKLIKTLKKHFSAEKPKQIMDMKLGESNSIKYFNKPLSKKVIQKIDLMKIIALIDETIKGLPQKNEWDFDKLLKNPVYKALSKFRSFLLMNQDKVIYEEKNLIDNSDEVKTLFQSISSVVKRKGLVSGGKKRPQSSRPPLIYKPEDLLSKKEKLDLSFISHEEEEGRNKRVKTLKEIATYTERDTRLLKGFREPAVAPTPLFRQKMPLHFKNGRDFFLQEEKIFRKVNPINYQKTDNFWRKDRAKLQRKKEHTILTLQAKGIQFNPFMKVTSKTSIYSSRKTADLPTTPTLH